MSAIARFLKETHCKRSAASYIPMLSVLISSIARIKSPDKTPALFAGPPGAAETTTNPEVDLSFAVGYPIDSPTPVRVLRVPDCLQNKYCKVLNAREDNRNHKLKELY